MINTASLAGSAALYMGVGAAVDLGINAAFRKTDAPKPTVGNVVSNAVITSVAWAAIGAIFHGKVPAREAAIVGAVQGAALSIGLNAVGQGLSHQFGV